MPLTGSQMISKVLAFFQAPDDPELKTIALEAMNSAVDLINSRDWQKIYGSSDIDLTTTDSEYALADDFKDPLRLLMLDSSLNRRGRLPFLINHEFYEFYQDSSVAGTPECYTVDYGARVIALSRVPNQAFVDLYPKLRSMYHRVVPHLTDGSDTLDLPTAFESFVIARGALWVARVRDQSKVQTLTGEMNERWGMLLVDDNNILTDFQ